MKRSRVLLTAHACEPGADSEPGAGWIWARLIARRHDTWLITRTDSVAAVEAARCAEGIAGLRVIGYDLPLATRGWKRRGRGAALGLYLWQLGLLPLARRLEREVGFDLVHDLTFSASFAPSGLAFLGPPFVRGPVGRETRIPDRFLQSAGLAARARELLRWAALGCVEFLDPLLEHTRERAARILATSEQAQRELPPRHRAKASVAGAVAIDPVVLPDARWPRGASWRVLFAGRLDDRKGVRLALEAFGRLAAREPDVTLTILGRGPLEGWIRRRTHALGLTRRVELPGHLPQPEVRRHMLGADVFLYPSLAGAGRVVLEAMAAGCAVVCLDHGGPGELVGAQRGLAVPLGTSAEGAIGELARALLRLHRDEDERRRLARAGWWWACLEQSWQARSEALERVYADLLPAAGSLRDSELEAHVSAARRRRLG